MKFEDAFELRVAKPLVKFVEYFLEWRLVAYERKLAKRFVKRMKKLGRNSP